MCVTSFTRVTLALAAVAVALATIALPRAGETGGDKVRALVEKSRKAWFEEQDARRARRLFARAIRRDPKDAKLRLDRVLLLLRILDTCEKARERKELRKTIEEDLAAIERLAPDTIMAGLARDIRRMVRNRVLMPPRREERCPSAVGTQAFERAEALFGAHRFEESLEPYRRAAEACPGNAAILTAWADANYVLGRYDRAEELFTRALIHDPWNRQTRRFLMDTELQRGDLEAAFEQAVQAVIADPTYEAGWEAIRALCPRVGRSYRRVYGRRTLVEKDDRGALKVTVPVPAEQDSGEPSPDLVNWTSFGILLAGKMTGTDEAEQTSAPSPYPELARVRSVVELICENDGDDASAGESASGERGPFWTMLCRAVDAGYAEQAVFVHLLDRRLVPEYLRYRESHGDRLREYVLEVLVPPSVPEGEAGAR